MRVGSYLKINGTSPSDATVGRASGAAILIDPDRSTTTGVMLCKKTRVLIEIKIE